MGGLVTHFKDKGHAWIIALSLVAVIAYIFYTRAAMPSEQQLTANVIVVLVAAGTVVSGVIALIVMASLSKNEFGELVEFRTPLILGILVGVIVSAIKLLSLFGLLNFAVK